jgi:hypothetical protein
MVRLIGDGDKYGIASHIAEFKKQLGQWWLGNCWGHPTKPEFVLIPIAVMF